MLDGWLFSTSIRYCPDCLAGNSSLVQQQYGGPWKKTWHLPVTSACLQHQRFPREGCAQAHPGGPAAWRLIAFPSASAPHPAQCRLPLQAGRTGRHRSSCGIRLDQPGEDGLPRPCPGTPDVQEHLPALLRPQHPAEDAARAFTHLRVISALLRRSWPLSQDLMDSRLAAAVSEHVRRLGAGYHQSPDRQPHGILATAGLLTAAAAVRGSADLEGTRESGLSARTIARRLSSVSGLYAYLVARGDTPVQANPVPRGLLTRRAGGSRRSRTAPLVRVPRTLPRILPPGEVDGLVGALRTHRDRAMVLAMLLAGLRRCEVLGLRFEDVQVADRRLAIVEGKGGHHRIVPVANRFFDVLGAYLRDERPAAARTDRVFVVLKGPRRGLPLSAEGLDEVLAGAAGGPGWSTRPATSCVIRA